MHDNITDLLARFDEWANERSDISERDGHDGGVSSSEWQGSDDDAFELLEKAIMALRQPIKVWTCAVKTPDSPRVIATVHNTEEDCWEWLREHYEPESAYDIYDPESAYDLDDVDASPVDIVDALENDGYVINIDVHEVTR